MWHRLLFALLIIFLAFPLPTFALVPTDPLYQQWGYTDTGVYDAWDVTVGSPAVTVAIIDNGFDNLHPELIDNVWKNVDEIPDNRVDDDHNGYIDDVNGWDFVAKDTNKDGRIDDEERKGDNDPRPNVSDLSPTERREGVFNHGTVIAGIIGAQGNNSRDGAGINWKVKLMNLRAVDREGTGDVEQVVKAIRYAVDNGAHVINVSVVGSHGEAITEAVDYAYQNGVALIAASGNNKTALNFSPLYPVCSDAKKPYEHVLGVSAINEDHRLASFSSSGADCVDLASPGVDIASTLFVAPEFNLGETYGRGWNGTSFAAPFVAGAAALVKSIQPQWGPDKIFEAIIKTVQHKEGQDETVYVQLFGAGLLRVDRAVRYALERKEKFAQKLLLVDPATGDVFERDFNSEKITQYRRVGLQGIDDVKSVKDPNGETRIVFARRLDAKKRLISIADKKWRTQTTWSIDAAGPVGIALGNAVGDAAPEIIVSPLYKTKKVYDVFSLDGTRLGGYSMDAEHQGARVALVASGERSEVIALLKEHGVVVVKRFDALFHLIDDMDIGSFKEAGDIAVGDIDRDGKDEYVITGGTSDGPYIAYYTDLGRLKRKFSVYSADKFKGLDIAISDYNADNENEVIVHARGTDLPVRWWSAKSKKLAEWTMGMTAKTNQLLILSL